MEGTRDWGVREERKLGDASCLCLVGGGLFYRKKNLIIWRPSSSESPDKNITKKDSALLIICKFYGKVCSCLRSSSHQRRSIFVH